MNISILGTGAWGTALAICFSGKHAITLWGRDENQIAAIKTNRQNDHYLAGISLPPDIELTSDFSQAISSTDLILSVVPTAGFRETLSNLAAITSNIPVIWACKGFEKSTGKLAHQIVQETLSTNISCGILSGPSFALEVAQGKPAALTLASSDKTFAQETAKELRNDRLRIYSSTDVVGVELGGAIKNIIAIAAGISDGLGLGNNARAALITRGLSEATRLGLHMGGQWETFMGLAGLGDMVLTTTGDLSRNRQVGLSLAHGHTIEHVLQNLGHVAEGVHTAPEVAKLASKLSIDMPITKMVCAIIEGKTSAQNAVAELMRRELKAEGMS